MKYSITLIIILLLPLPTLSAATPETVITLDDYHSGISPKWKEKKFKGQTHYQASLKDGLPCISATSSASASGLFYAISYDPETSPLLTWQWQIDNVLTTGDATKKSGDDYPARIYVVFPSAFFWRTKALNYIWDTRLPVGTFIANAYTSNAMMIVVESGPEKKGRWISEKRNIRDDFIKAFGEPPPKVGAIAIMTDTDDTGETAQAWYGPIQIRKTMP